MKAYRLLKNSLFVRLLGILMVFFFLSGSQYLKNQPMGFMTLIII